MKKQCPQCHNTFFGRTDKTFCSVSCKNQYHNLLKKSDVASRIDQSLHRNRTLLRKLTADTKGPALWDRQSLLKLGFDFRVFTGLVHKDDGTTAYRTYDFVWQENDQGQIVIYRVEDNITA